MILSQTDHLQYLNLACMARELGMIEEADHLSYCASMAAAVEHLTADEITLAEAMIHAVYMRQHDDQGKG